jgi:hypothetical protein
MIALSPQIVNFFLCRNRNKNFKGTLLLFHVQKHGRSPKNTKQTKKKKPICSKTGLLFLHEI